MAGFAHGSPVWADLLTTDMTRAQEFYGKVFGWTFESPAEEFGGYVNALLDGERIAGLMTRDPEDEQLKGVPDFWTLYFASDDIDATFDAAQAAGAAPYIPVAEVGELGKFAMLGDAVGAGFGLWESAGHKGFAQIHVPGSPFWFELLARDVDAAKDFYAKTLGWEYATMEDSEHFRYFTVGAGHDAKAGLMEAGAFLPEGVPSNWQIYWGVEDADAACAAISELGGSVIQPVEDTPFGRIATVADPFGAVFKLAQGTPNAG